MNKRYRCAEGCVGVYPDWYPPTLEDGSMGPCREHHLPLVVVCEHCEDGDTPSFSTGIHGGTTAGHGELDDQGFWEYPCPLQEAHCKELDAEYGE